MGRFSYSSSRQHFRGRYPIDIIYKTAALKQYDITEEELATLKPVSTESNPHNSRRPMVAYAECDVKRLSWKLREGKLKAKDAKRAEVEVMRSKAVDEYNVSPADLDRLKPCREAPNRHPNARGPTRFYKRKDVERLVKTLEKERAQIQATIAKDIASSQSQARAAEKAKAKAEEEEEEELWDAFEDDDSILALADASNLF